MEIETEKSPRVLPSTTKAHTGHNLLWDGQPPMDHTYITRSKMSSKEEGRYTTCRVFSAWDDDVRNRHPITEIAFLVLNLLDVGWQAANLLGLSYTGWNCNGILGLAGVTTSNDDSSSTRSSSKATVGPTTASPSRHNNGLPT